MEDRMDLDEDEQAIAQVLSIVQVNREHNSFAKSPSHQNVAIHEKGPICNIDCVNILFVLDTNFLLSHMTFCEDLLRYTNAEKELAIVIPWTVLQELDGLKSNEGTCGYLARQAHTFLLEQFQQAHTGIYGQRVDEQCRSGEKGDNSILDCCIYFQNERLKRVILLSDDKNLCVKSAVHAIETFSLTRKTHAYDFLVSVIGENLKQQPKSLSQAPAIMEVDVVAVPSPSIVSSTRASTVDFPMDAQDNSAWSSRYARVDATTVIDERPTESLDIAYDYPLLSKQEILASSHPRTLKLLDQITKVLVEHSGILLVAHLTNVWETEDLAIQTLHSSNSFPPQNINDVAFILERHWGTCFDGYIPFKESSRLKSIALDWEKWMLWAENGTSSGPESNELLLDAILFWVKLWRVLSRQNILQHPLQTHSLVYQAMQTRIASINEPSAYAKFREQQISKWTERALRPGLLS